MKILNSSVLLDPVTGGGTSERTYQMSRAFARAGHDVSILTTDIGMTPERFASLEGIRVVALRAVWKRFHVVAFSWKELRRMVESADILHLMGHWNVLSVLLYFQAKRAGKPYVVCPAGELRIFGRSRWLKRLFNVVIGYRILRGADAVVAITSDELPDFAAYGIDAGRACVIPNGIDESDFEAGEAAEFRERFGLKDAPFVLFMGRLNVIKGPDLLLDAFCAVSEKFPDRHLVFAGPDGGLLAQLRQTAERRGVAGRVHFTGFLSHRLKAAAYRAADFLAIPSRQEAMSIVVLEAGIAGTPVLLTDRCGFDELADTGGGRVVAATVDALAGGLADLLGRRCELPAMGERLREFVRRGYPWERIARLYLELFARVRSSCATPCG